MSYKFRGTPGSWVQQYGELRGSNKKPVTVWGLGIAHGGRSEESEANACAIAELPELISVLTEIVERWDKMVPEDEISEEHKRARSVLTKATGGGDV